MLENCIRYGDWEYTAQKQNTMKIRRKKTKTSMATDAFQRAFERRREKKHNDNSRIFLERFPLQCE